MDSGLIEVVVEIPRASFISDTRSGDGDPLEVLDGHRAMDAGDRHR
jgi:hypothetical protein